MGERHASVWRRALICSYCLTTNRRAGEIFWKFPGTSPKRIRRMSVKRNFDHGRQDQEYSAILRKRSSRPTTGVEKRIIIASIGIQQRRSAVLNHEDSPRSWY